MTDCLTEPRPVSLLGRRTASVGFQFCDYSELRAFNLLDREMKFVRKRGHTCDERTTVVMKPRRRPHRLPYARPCFTG